MSKLTVEEKSIAQRLREYADSYMRGSAVAEEGAALMREAAEALALKSAQFSVSYDYNHPSNAGPFKGKMTMPRRYLPGEHIAAPFGAATVRSCREVRS